MDELRDDIWQNHSEIHIIDFDFYSVDIFNRCENSNDVLMAVQAWEHVHPLLKVIPVEWDHSIPYGLQNRVITHEYKLMNESRLLWKPRFFYTIGGKGHRSISHQGEK